MVALLHDIEGGAYRIENLVSDDYIRIREVLDRYEDTDTWGGAGLYSE